MTTKKLAEMKRNYVASLNPEDRKLLRRKCYVYQDKETGLCEMYPVNPMAEIVRQHGGVAPDSK
jgi:hypothetical protein